MCLGIACLGATSAAEQEPTAMAQLPASGDGGLVLIKSDTESIILELSTPSYQVEEIGVTGVPYHLLTVAGYGRIGDVGKPQLPFKGTMLGIPPAAEFSLRVLDVDGDIVAERYDIYPVPAPVFEHDLEGNPTYMTLEFARDETLYTSNTFYPANVAEIGSSGFIRDQRVLELRLYPFQYNPVTEELRHFRRMRVELSFSYPRGRSLLAQTREEGDPFRDVLQNSLLNYDSAKNWRARTSPSFVGAVASDQAQPSYKVLLDQDGIYTFTGTYLQDQGIDIGSVDLNTLKLHNRGHEVAIQVVDADEEGDLDPLDYVLFYGEQVTSTYTSGNVYWLSWGGSPGLRMSERDGTLGEGALRSSFGTASHWEEDRYYRPDIPAPATIPSEGGDHWFGGYVFAYLSPASRSYAIELDNLDISAPPYSSTVQGSLAGRTDFPDTLDHHVKVYLNGQEIYEAQWDGLVEHEFEAQVPESYLVEGANTIRVECPLGIPGVDWDLVFVNWLEIGYQRTYAVDGDSLLFDGDETGTWQYEVGDFTTDAIEVFDITDPLSVTRIVSTTIVEAGSYTLKLEDTVEGEHHYLALTPAHHQTPGVAEYTPSDITDTSNAADYIIITHPDFYTDVLSLRDYRIAEGLDVTVVDVRDIYDEFSFGIFDPHAIRDFIAHAYKYWRGPDAQHAAPSYVLLVGDGNYDFKDNLGTGEPNYVPPYLVYADEWWGETAADNRYVCVSAEGADDILPDMYIGRLPAQTGDQAAAMIDKILEYEESLPGGDWRRQVLFVADNPDDGGDFPFLSDDIADHHLPPLYTADKAYQEDPYADPELVRNAILNAFGTGRLFINYVGHAWWDYWGGYPHDSFLATDEISSLPESENPPIMLAMACLEGYFIQPSQTADDQSCVGESLVRAEGKGAVASWSPTGEGLAVGQHYLHEGFYDAVFVDGVHQLGPAALLGKLNLYANAGGGHRELIDTYTVFGDPALRLPVECYVKFAPLVFKGY
jgi:hypothetical protein